MATYFTADGSYGDAHQMIILDTHGWNEDQWTRIDEAGDRDRLSVAVDIALENGDI